MKECHCRCSTFAIMVRARIGEKYFKHSYNRFSQISMC